MSLRQPSLASASRLLIAAYPVRRPVIARLPWACRGYSCATASAFRFGQPVHETHPHMLGPGELTPGITAKEYADRRAALALTMTEDSMAVLCAAPVWFKSGAVFYPYRQETNLFWLTGWAEDGAIVAIERTGPQPGDYIFRMYVKRKDPLEEQWSGWRNGVEAARHVFNADESHPLESLGSLIAPSTKLLYTDMLPNCSSISDRVGSDRALSKLFFAANNRARDIITPLSPVMDTLRATKSVAEVKMMRKVGQASGRAITQAMRTGWTRENHLHAFLNYQFVVNGTDGPAYIPVVAGGDRGNCIHYTVNNDRFQDGETILVDAGAEYGSYISDISRTWPVSGRFTAAQRALYEAVLAVQRTGVSLCRESAGMSLDDIHHITTRELVDQLKALGFDVNASTIGLLFPHHVGHYVGLDVHDCPSYSRRETLRKGHCLTIEPGIYVHNDSRWPSHFRGMSVRIEDSICVDDDSPLVLTTEAVKEVADIEALRS